MRRTTPSDPYAAPHAPKECGGAVVRLAVMAMVLGGAALGWSYFASQPSHPLAAATNAPAIEQPVRLADAGPIPAPETAPAAAPAAATPAPVARHATQPRSRNNAAPAEAPQVASPPPETSDATSDMTPAPAPAQTPQPIAPM